MKKYIKDKYLKYGINIDEVLEKLANITISLHCWQLDDVNGFEDSATLSGGIQSTGDYPGKAGNFKELTDDLTIALQYIPGKKKINLHSIYQSDNLVDRSEITIEQFKSWIKYAKNHDLGLDFNPTVFSSPMLVDGLSLSSPDENVRNYWIKHCINSIKLTEEISKELGKKSLCNIWIPDGLKEVPSDRLGPRSRLEKSLDKIFEYKFDNNLIDVSLESKVFGIGVESYTVGSHEFYMNYCAKKTFLDKQQVLCLLDTGHFHEGENVADKISSLLLFNDKLAFHVSRPVRWDSDHVLKLNDQLQEVADELVKCDALERTYIGLDYFDGSINRVAALIIGARNIQKALLKALLTPWNLLKEAQDSYDHTKVLALQEEIKTLPWTIVWEEYCLLNNISLDDEWYQEVIKYENEVLKLR